MNAKFCKRCGKIMWDVASNRKFCKECVRKQNNEKGKKRYAAKKKREESAMPKKPEKQVPLRCKIKSIEQCAREAHALGISYGQYVARGLDKEEAVWNRKIL